MTMIPESLARAILAAAIAEDRAGELLECLFDNGTATVDREGKLILLPGVDFAEMLRGDQ